MTIPKHTKLQCMIGDALDRPPDHQDVTDVIEATAEWFTIVGEQIGIQPSSIPTLLRWQYLHGDCCDD